MLHEIECSYCHHKHEVTGRRVVAFSGSREKYWTPEGRARAIGELNRVFDRLLEVHGDAHLVVSVGDANGIDALVREGCDYFGLCYVVHRANWRDQGSFAGHERNGRVLDGADELIAIMPGPRQTPGTGNCVYQAERRGIPVHEWRGKWLR